MPKVYIGIQSPALIKSQQNNCRWVVCVLEKALLIVILNGSSCTACLRAARRHTASTSWLRNICLANWETKFHFNIQSHTYGFSPDKCSQTSHPEWLLGINHWKAVMLSARCSHWMLSFVLINNGKNKLLYRINYLENRSKMQSSSCVEKNGSRGDRDPCHHTRAHRGGPGDPPVPEIYLVCRVMYKAAFYEAALI